MSTPTRWMDRFAWLRRRFESMPPEEVPHRIREALLRQADAHGAAERALVSLPPALLASAPPALPISPEAIEALDRDARAAIEIDARAILDDRFTLLGVRAAGRTAWDVDPQTGERWPEGPAWSIPLEQDRKDIKLAWELHRLQHAQILALAVRLGLVDAEALWEIVGSWLRTVEPYRGIAWAGGIECGLRVISLLTIAGVVGADAVPDALRPAWWRSLYAHGAWIERYPSRYSSANNHRVAELVGLVLLGNLAPSLPGAARWRGASSELRSTGMAQFHRDGVGVEQSPTYQAFTMELLLVASRVVPLGGRLEARLRRAVGFLDVLAGPGGVVPRIGDDDEGRALRGVLQEPAYVCSVATAARTMLSDTGGGDSPADPRAALLGLASVQPRPPRLGAFHTFPDGGYTILRRTVRGHRLAVVLDHGPLGFRWTASHGHADALAVWMRIDGLPVLVDRGTFRYNGGGGWRDYARHTAAHNTVVVDGACQSEITGPFNWGRRADAWLVALDDRSVTGAHDGYPDDLRHSRLVRVGDALVYVEDYLDGQGHHDVDVWWHLAPDLDAAVQGREVVVRRFGTEILRIEVDPALTVQLRRDGERPGPGTHSPAYNVWVPATSIRLMGTLALPVRLPTVFRPV